MKSLSSERFRGLHSITQPVGPPLEIRVYDFSTCLVRPWSLRRSRTKREKILEGSTEHRAWFIAGALSILMDESMGRWMVDGWVDGQVGGWMGGWMDGKMRGWTNELPILRQREGATTIFVVS